jgi:uncharacterized protein (DUF305 family)
MKPTMSTLAASLSAIGLAMSLTASALAQAAPDHHPGATPPATLQAPSATQAPAATGQPQMMQMPEQCRAMMQNMPPGCMAMMRQMMQGGMMGQGSPAATSGQSEATTAYVAAMDKMHGPMMEGVKAAEPDVAFVRGMIPHHQGAIDMAQVVLKYGKDEQTKKWAEDVIRQQQREIDEMQAWLAKRQ